MCFVGADAASIASSVLTLQLTKGGCERAERPGSNRIDALLVSPLVIMGGFNCRCDSVGAIARIREAAPPNLV